MSATAQKERTPQEIAAAKDRMAKARAAKKSKEVMPIAQHQSQRPEIRPRHSQAGGAAEHKRAPELPTDELEGLTAKDCCNSCYASKGERCAITHRDFCGHPLKSGIQQPDMLNPETVARYQRAKKILAHAKIEAR